MLGVRAFMCNSLPASTNIFHQQTRNTFILKRKIPLPLHKKGGKPTKMRGRHFVYDLVQDTNICKKPDMKIILNQFVDGVGNKGDILSLPPNKAYSEYLIPGLAAYASPRNLEKYKVDESKPKTEEKFSSPYVLRTMGRLSKQVLQITMNKIEPWTLEPWHISASFRKSGFFVPEYAIEMPPIKIKGPDLSLQDKEFYITVTVLGSKVGIVFNQHKESKRVEGRFLKVPLQWAFQPSQINNKEKVNVRCRIHHWATGLDRLPWEEFHWRKPKEPLISEQAAVLESIPLVS